MGHTIHGDGPHDSGTKDSAARSFSDVGQELNPDDADRIDKKLQQHHLRFPHRRKKHHHHHHHHANLEEIRRSLSASGLTQELAKSTSSTSTTGVAGNVEVVVEDTRDLSDPLAPPARLLADAKKKLGETFDVRHAGLVGMKKCIESYNEKTPKAQRVEFMRKDDWFLMAFLRCKKFNVQRAFDEFLNYSTFHYENGWLRDGVDRDLVRRMFSSGAFQVLPTRDPSGRLIVSMGSKAFVPMVEELGPSRIMEIVKAVFFLLEVVIADIEAQIFGAAIVADFSATKIKILTYLSPSEYQMCLHLCQACYPLRANGMYIIREPWYMRTVWAIIRPFMNTKVKRRFKTFGKDWNGMFDYIPKDSLTKLYGGNVEFDAEDAAKRWIAAVDVLIARG